MRICSLSIILVVYLASSCLKKDNSKRIDSLNYQKAINAAAPLPYYSPSCSINDNISICSLKSLNGKWRFKSAIQSKNYIVTFQLENDSNTLINIVFPYFRQNMNASYELVGNGYDKIDYVNCIRISGSFRVTKFNIPFYLGKLNNYEMVPISYQNNQYTLTVCNTDFGYNVNGVDVRSTITLKLVW